MKKNTKIILIFFIYLITYFTFNAFSYPVPDGDSLNYHIPIAKSYLTGDILNPEKIGGIPYMKYSPGASEGILSLFFLLKIPIQLFNVIGAIFLFACCYLLGRKVGLKNDLSIIFAVVISSVPIVLRWINMQIIDIWLAGFFTLTLLLLESLRNKKSHYFLIGTSAGFLIGSKFSGPLYLLVLVVFYFKRISNNFNIKYFIYFLIPFILIGLFWYVRNFIFTGNPFYPQAFLFFDETGFEILRTQVWEVSLTSFIGVKNFIDAGFGEFSLWFFSIFVSVLLIIKDIKKRKANKYRKYILIGISNFVIFLFLPSDKYFHIFVSVFRYTFPVYIPMILAIFMYLKEIGREDYLYFIAFLSLLISPVYEYHPKILLIVLPIAFYVYFIIPDRNNKNAVE